MAGLIHLPKSMKGKSYIFSGKIIFFPCSDGQMSWKKTQAEFKLELGSHLETVKFCPYFKIYYMCY